MEQSHTAIGHVPNRSAFSTRRSFLARSLIATLVALVVAQMLAAVGVGPLAPVPAFAAQSLSCRLVADGGGGNGGNDLYTVVDTTDFNAATNELSVGTGTGTFLVEANASSAFTGAFYGLNASQLGTINTTSGVWSSAGLAPVGSGEGSLLNQTFDDVDSLSFDPYTGLMWAAHRRDPGLDLLILIDPATGSAIPDAFGTGVDYVPIGASGTNEDIDDLAFDVETGRLYGVANSGGNNADLVIIDMTDGSVTTVGATGAFDAEGLTIDQFGQLWITTGASPYRLYEVDKFTAVASLPRTIDNGSDYESADCWTLFGTNTVSGTTFIDSDSSGTYNTGDLPLVGATVTLYRDVNSDGLIDAGDWPLTTRDSAGDGSFSFTFAADGNFVLGVDPADLPPEWSYTTTDVHVASFVGVGNSDPGNDFGGNSGSIGDFVWDDVNGDGVQDGGEPGIDGVTVDLWRDNNSDGIINGGDVLVGTETTSAGGWYDLALLTADDYIVDVTDTGAVLAGKTFTGGTDPLSVSLSAGADFNGADFGYQTPVPDIAIEKSTNTQDADTAPGPYVAVGGVITWDYTVTNTGNVEVTVAITDDNGTPGVGDDFAPTYVGGDTDGDSKLDVTETWTYQATGTAAAGPYGNVVLVTGTPTVGPAATDTDPSHYFGEDARVVVEKATNTQDADTAPGPYVAVGGAITWTYSVTNPGNVALSGVTVTDDNGTPGVGDDFAPTYLGGDTNGDSQLDTTETWTYSATTTAVAGPYGNVATADATAPSGATPTNTDPSHYFGEDARVVVEKATNGSDADTAPGPVVATGSTITWDYSVTNPGNVALSGVTVTDDNGTPGVGDDFAPTYLGGDTNGDSELDTTETWTYQATGTATGGQYANLATVTAAAPSGATPTNTDPSHYFGAGAGVAVEKSTNTQDADTAPGPYVAVGGVITWDYTVTNTGNVEVTVAITDDNGTPGVGDDFAPTYVGGDTDGDSKLDVTETWTYQATGTAAAGPYGNVVLVTGTPTVGPAATDTDPSHYFGEDARVVVEKATNTQDADTAPGPYVAVGGAITWTYSVTNPGNVALSGVTVTDDNGTPGVGDDFAPTYLGGDTNGDSQLDTTETWTYSATTTAVAGPYGNVATADATAPSGATPTNTDPSHYFGADPDIAIEKATNGSDADTAPGPYLPVGGGVTWTYSVTNPGNVALGAVSVTDDQGVTVSYVGGDANSNGLLEPTETWSYDAVGTAAGGPYANIGTASATPPGGLPGVSDTDPSHYFGEDARVVVEKATNTQDADTAPGPYVAVGGAITWTYSVTNPGNVALSGVTVTDDNGTPGVGDDFAPTYLGGDTNGDSQLDTTETWTYSATTTAVAGPYGNVATADATAPSGATPTNTDPSHYFGEDARVVVEKATNGSDADTAPGPVVATGSTITWDYSVTNPGNVALSGVTVTDDNGTPGVGDDFAPTYLGGDTNGDSELDTTETWTYQATGTATGGQYANLATVTAAAPSGATPTNTDPSHYFGAGAGVAVEKSTNTQDADTAPGPYVAVGGVITWDYTVTNTGNVEVTVAITDDNGTPGVGDDFAPTYVGGDTDGDSKLDVTETWTYQATGTAAAGPYGNVVLVTGTPTVGPAATDTDPSHYFGEDARVVVEKATNTQDADTAPGPYVAVGGAITWTYSVTNPGNVALSGVTVTDDNGTPGVGDDFAPTYLGGDTNGDSQLDTTETWTYSATTTAVAGPYGNVATADATAPSGATPTNTDPSHYFGADPDIAIEKATNGSDADTAPGPYLPVGGGVTWTYSVTNPGNVALGAVSVTDDQGVTVSYVGGDANSNGLLEPTETWSYDAVGTAAGGPYANIGTASATPPGGLPGVSDTDPSHYFGEDARVVVEKATNTQDADTAPGPYVAVGGAITWTYSVTNPGNVALSGVTVTDDNGTPGVGDDFAPTYLGGDTNGDSQLDTTETWTYSATTTAVAGPYGNVATADATAPSGATPTNTDPSHYFGEDARVVVEKATNGSDADTAPGPVVATGSTITWDYSVTNPGNVALSGVTVTDDNGTPGVGDDFAPTYLGGDTNGDSELDTTETWTYQATGTATGGQYANLATVTAAAPSGATPTNTDPSHYFGAGAGVAVEKSTNTQDADTAPGPYVAVGGVITWDYTVTNTGNVEVTVAITDDNGTPGVGDDFAPTYVGGDTDGDSKLDVTETWTYQATGTAAAGPYGNVVLVTGTPTVGPAATDTDPSHYFGEDARVVVEKATNTQDADTAPGPYVAVGGAITWTYSVTNPGNVALSGVTVTDDNGTPGVGDDFAPTYLGGDTNGDSQLDTTETWTYSATTTAVAGPYGNVATADATAPSGATPTNTDPSHYFGADPDIAIEKATNGSDADTAPGPYLPVGGGVTWTYSVTNPGNVALGAVSVTDDQGVTVSYVGGDANSNGLLEPTETWSYDAVGTAAGGPYANIGTASATPPGGLPGVSDTDPSHYFGEDARVVVEKATNTQDADTAPGPYVAVGGAITWTYSVTNPGNVALSGVTVTDDNGTPGVGDDFAPTYLGGDTNGDSQLDTTETWTYSATTTAVAGPYGNVATADATAPSGATPTNTDPSHYFGEDARVVVEKATNGSDADTAPGPVVATGSTITWDYSVTNPGNVALSGVTVTDDNGTPGVGDDFAPTYLGGDTNGDSELDTTETWTYQATGTATGGQYANLATVTAAAPSGATPTNTDPSHYFGAGAGVAVEKSTNTQDADTAPGPYVAVGGVITWDYTVTNTGNVEVTVAITDDNGTPGVGDDFAPTYVGGDTDGDSKLDVTETWTYQATGTAAAGPYGNVVLVTGTPTVGPAATDTDPSHYFGEDARVVVEKATNTQDADTAPGPYVAVGGAITWTYSVTNPGNVALSGVTVTDDNGTPGVGDDFAPTYLGGDTNGDSQLDTTETWTYSATTTAVAGPYGNVATADATAPSGATPTNTDPSHYFGADGSIGDFVWNDLNGDGIQDPGEPGVAGITVTLVGAGPNGTLGDGDDVVFAPQVTGAAGGYDFAKLSPGVYEAELDLASVPGGFVATTPTSLTVTLALDEDFDAADFAVWDPGSIGDIVWNDSDADGLFDGSESGLGGIAVELYTTADLSTPMATTGTGPTGAYSFTGLAPGSYTVKFVPPAGFVFSPQDAAGDTVDSDADPVTGLSHVVVLAPGDDDITVDAGMNVPLPAALGDVVWNDLNGDGSQDGGEPGVAGVTVHLYDASNSSEPLATTTTDASGNYRFENLDAALIYIVGFELPAGALGFTQDHAVAAASDSDADPATGLTDQLSLAAGARDDTVDCGLLYPAFLGDRVWYDVNGNGVQDSNEPGVGGVVVQLLDATGAVVATTATAVPTVASDPAAGTYVFENLAPGFYTVVVDQNSLPAGMTVSTFDADGGKDGKAGVSLAGGDSRLDLDFGFVGVGVIGDTVWNDLNGSAVQDFGDDGVFEAGIVGVTVTVIWAGPDNVLGTPDDYHFDVQATDVKGNYLYSGLPFGQFQVEVGEVDALVLQVANVQVVTLDAVDGAVAGEVLSVDFPFRVLATSESLPYTGADTDRIAGLGLILLLGGAFVLLITRKRRENA